MKKKHIWIKRNIWWIILLLSILVLAIIGNISLVNEWTENTPPLYVEGIGTFNISMTTLTYLQSDCMVQCRINNPLTEREVDLYIPCRNKCYEIHNLNCQYLIKEGDNQK